MKPIALAKLLKAATLWQQFCEGDFRNLEISDRTLGAKNLAAIA